MEGRRSGHYGGPMGRVERSGDPATARPNRLPTAFHRRVLDQEPGAIIVVDATGSILYTNDALLELGGCARGQIYGG